MQKDRAGYVEGIVSILVNTGLFGLKLWAGIVSGSLALTADAWHTLSDSLSSIIVILGVKLSSQKADKKHPFGHGRWEQISSIFIGFLLAIIAFDFLRDAWKNLETHESANFGTIAILVTIASILVKEGLAQYAFFLGKKSGNMSVKADGWHHRTDALSSLVVLIGIFFSSRFWWIDSVLGGLIAFMLFYAVYEIIREAINKLLGEKPSEDLLEQINGIIKRLGHQNIYPHHFHIHNYINQKELTFHIKLDPSLDIYAGHKISTEIENKIQEELGITSTIHIEPYDFEHRLD